MFSILFIITIALLYFLMIIFFFAIIFPLDIEQQNPLSTCRILYTGLKEIFNSILRKIQYFYQNFGILFKKQKKLWMRPRLTTFLLLLASVFILGLWKTWPSSNDSSDFKGYILNLYTDFLSLIATYGIIDYLIQKHDDETSEKKLIKRFILEAGSTSNEQAKAAVNFLQKADLLSGNQGLLKGENLFGANLKEADFSFADLRGVKFVLANLHLANFQNANLENSQLEQADFSDADLEGAILDNSKCNQTKFVRANLSTCSFRNVKLHNADMSESKMLYTNLEQADLSYANLTNSNLYNANLQDTILARANLCGADLTTAKLKNAKIYQILVDESTIFPDGKCYTENELPKAIVQFGALIAKPSWEL